MKDSEMTVRLWQMKQFMDAYEKNHVSAPNKTRGMRTPDGWINNIFWNGKKANDGFAEQRRLRREFPGYFESEKVEVLKKTYGNWFYVGNSSKLEAQRIKPEMRKTFSRIVCAEIIIAEERRKK